MIGRIFKFLMKNNFVNKGRDINEFVLMGDHEMAHLNFQLYFLQTLSPNYILFTIRVLDSPDPHSLVAG